MSQTTALPFASVREFIARQKAAGRYNPATARNLEAACAHIEPVLEPGNDTVGFAADNLDDILARYANLNQHVGQASIATYRARVRRAISDFIGHRTDPQWRPASRAKRQSAGTPAPAVTSSQVSKGTAPSTTENPGALRHRLPLRSDFDVEVVLPRDLSAKEARRVLAWISALAVDEEPDAPPSA
jgi:hypothetical protein